MRNISSKFIILHSQRELTPFENTAVSDTYFGTLPGYTINTRIERLEQRVTHTEKQIDFFVRTALPPVEGIFFFLCIDSTVYHIGASLKDLGKKWFAFSRMELKAEEVVPSLHFPGNPRFHAFPGFGDG